MHGIQEQILAAYSELEIKYQVPVLNELCRPGNSLETVAEKHFEFMMSKFGYYGTSTIINHPRFSPSHQEIVKLYKKLTPDEQIMLLNKLVLYPETLIFTIIYHLEFLRKMFGDMGTGIDGPATLLILNHHAIFD